LRRYLSLVVVVLMLAPIAVGAAIYVLQLIAARSGGSTTAGGGYVTELAVPFRPGDYVAILITRKAAANGSEVHLGSGTIAGTIEEIGWPFTRLRIGETGEAVQIPTYLLAAPTTGFSAPLYVSLIGEYICMPFTYSDSYGDTVVLESTTPESCASIRASLYYSRSGLFRSATIIYGVGDAPVIERIEMVASSRSGETKIPIDSSLCAGYASRNIMYTTPGLYLYAGGRLIYSYSYGDALSSREVLFIVKRPTNQELWEAVVDGKYRGWAVVVSPLLRGFWNLPHLDELNTYGAVLIRGNEAIPITSPQILVAITSPNQRS